MQWLFPVVVTLHNTEEAIWMPSWESAHAASLPFHPPTAARIWLVLLAFTLAAFAISYLSARKGPRSAWAYLLFGYIVAVLANVLVPHLPAAILFHGYAPGVVTAVAINLPVMCWLALLSVRDGWVAGWKAVAFAIAVPAFWGSMIIAILAPSIL